MADARTAETIDWARYAGLALAEDCAAEDATTLATVDPALVGTAIFLAKEAGVLAGMPLAAACFAAIDPSCVFESFFIII